MNDSTLPPDNNKPVAPQNNDVDPPTTDEQPIRLTDSVASRPGRIVTIAGIIERIIEQFIAEYGYDPNRYPNMTDETDRRSNVRAISEYIFSVESLQLDRATRARIIHRAYDEIFGYGPLNELFEDETVTTISLEGAEKIAVRYGIGTELVPLEPIFEDSNHLKRMMKRLLGDAKAELNDDDAIIEVGLSVGKRPVSISIIAPPITPELTADIRVHPVKTVHLDALIENQFLPSPMDKIIHAIIRSSYGFIIVGDTESGKTTFLNAIANTLPSQRLIAVERAGEMRLPDFAQSLRVRWQYHDQVPKTFGEQILEALALNPDTLLLDEVRADEASALQPLLANDNVPRQIWSFRGGAMPKRIRSALSQIARMSSPAQPEAMVNALYRRLPYVIILRRRQGHIQVRSIAEWQFNTDMDYADWVTLASVVDNQVEFEGQLPSNALDLPDSFWKG